jgi:hypothetical protein
MQGPPVLDSDALAMLEKLIGTVEAPSDWAAEHDHYLYGTPERDDQEPRRESTSSHDRWFRTLVRQEILFVDGSP